MTEEDLEAQLIAAQLRHAIDLMQADLNAVKAEQSHVKEMADHRLGQLEKSRDDHEERIRLLQDGVTGFKTWSHLANGGSSLMSIIALIKSFLP
jgi:hypothetical protein